MPKDSWDSRHKREHCERNKRYRRKLKHEALQAYGGKCVDCEETKESELEFDHENGNGNIHRSKIFGYGHASPGGWMFYLWLKKCGYPRDLGLAIRCEKCHTKKHPNRQKKENRKGSPALQNPKEMEEELQRLDPIPF